MTDQQQQAHETGEPDPHGSRYDCERAKLCGGHLTDDEVAFETAMLMRGDLNHEAVLQTAKDRIRWLSRQLAAAASSATVLQDALDRIEAHDDLEIQGSALEQHDRQSGWAKAMRLCGDIARQARRGSEAE